MNIQRDIIYKERNRFIKQEGRLDVIVEQIVREVFMRVADNKDYIDPIAFYRYIFGQCELSGGSADDSSIIPF